MVAFLVLPLGSPCGVLYNKGFLNFARAMSHAGQCLNTARRVLAHVRAYLDIGQYGERRDNEQAQACECRHGIAGQGVPVNILPQFRHFLGTSALLLLYYYFIIGRNSLSNISCRMRKAELLALLLIVILSIQ